jgi:hypothetical protein
MCLARLQGDAADDLEIALADAVMEDQPGRLGQEEAADAVEEIVEQWEEQLVAALGGRHQPGAVPEDMTMADVRAVMERLAAAKGMADPLSPCSGALDDKVVAVLCAVRARTKRGVGRIMAEEGPLRRTGLERSRVLNAIMAADSLADPAERDHQYFMHTVPAQCNKLARGVLQFHK